MEKMDANSSTSTGPIRPSQRFHIIDILRGFAIFGILLVNMEFFNNSFYAMVIGDFDIHSTLDQIGRWLIAFFGEGKFYSTFSFLFGLGMALQYARAQDKGQRFVPFYLRRMFVLFLIGLVHAYLFWVGDILILYSLLGTVLLIFFRNRRPKTLLVWTIIFLLVPIILNAALLGLTTFGRMTPEGAAMMEDVFSEQMRTMTAADTHADLVYATGTFAEITQQRIEDMKFVFTTWPFMGFNVFAMFVLGLYAGKQKLYENSTANVTLWRKVWIWGLIIGVIGNLVYVIFGEDANRSMSSPQLLISIIGQTFGAPALALFYMTSLALLFQRPQWQPRLMPLSFVGRMALTNYLLQTVICTVLFYGYGFGLYSRVGIAGGILLTAVLYTLQIILSKWWLSRYRFGPMEWLWRSATYLKLQPMRM
jgi:uncharacterized protein